MIGDRDPAIAAEVPGGGRVLVESSTSPGWTRLGAGPSGRLVLAVDFDGTGRQEATFRELVRLLPDGLGLDVWHAVPPRDPGDLTPDSYLRWWLETPEREARKVEAVFGYCAGSVFACALADVLETRQGRRPAVVLFNPGPPSVATVSRDLGGAIRGMEALTGEERDALHRRVAELREEHGEDFEKVGKRFAELYREASKVVFERWEVDEDVGEELTGLFRAYVAYLAAARALVPAESWGSAASLTAAEQRGSGFTDHEVVFDLPRGELLRSPDVASAVGGLLQAPVLKGGEPHGC